MPNCNSSACLQEEPSSQGRGQIASERTWDREGGGGEVMVGKWEIKGLLKERQLGEEWWRLKKKREERKGGSWTKFGPSFIRLCCFTLIKTTCDLFQICCEMKQEAALMCDAEAHTEKQPPYKPSCRIRTHVAKQELMLNLDLTAWRRGFTTQTLRVFNTSTNTNSAHFPLV